MMGKGSFLKLFIITGALFLFVAASSCSRQPSYPAPPQIGTNIVIDIAGLEPDTPAFYTYRYQGRSISLFALKLDGTVMAFFDACASCYAHHKGYRCEKGDVVCRYCNIRFPIYKLEKGLGNCFPIKIAGRTENGKYVIPVALLEAEAGKF